MLAQAGKIRTLRGPEFDLELKLPTLGLEHCLRVAIVVLLLPALLAVAATTGIIIAVQMIARTIGSAYPIATRRGPLSAVLRRPYNLAREEGRPAPTI